uniref:DNA-directed RNA polymerase subunit n=1 Tax=Strigamia maritima TaxID=126957 RepID=T1IXA7_STRMM
MLLFCPTCANLLVIKQGFEANRFMCNSCPYVHNIRRKMVAKTYPKPKALDDILGSSEVWENVDNTEATCPKCSHTRAAFFQMQTRSADEPMTIFYKCLGCGNTWRD